MNKWVWIGIIIVVLLAILRFWTPEDTWICENGQWVQHGHPSIPAPTSLCG